MKKAIIIGVWDLLHVGHIRKFERLAELGYEVIVGVTTDKFTQKYKRSPIINQKQRMHMVSKIKGVTGTFFYYDNLIKVLDVIKPDVIAYGSDWDSDKYLKHMNVTPEDLRTRNIKEIQLPYSRKISTTEIIRRCKNE